MDQIPQSIINSLLGGALAALGVVCTTNMGCDQRAEI
jgi:hypothetical protein